jgi:hypothetical protein
MNLSVHESASRREFLRTAGRRLGLSASVGLAAFLVTTRRVSTVRQECVSAGLCEGCAIFARCVLPAALAIKNPSPGGPT